MCRTDVEVKVTMASLSIYIYSTIFPDLSVFAVNVKFFFFFFLQIFGTDLQEMIEDLNQVSQVIAIWLLDRNTGFSTTVTIFDSP